MPLAWQTVEATTSDPTGVPMPDPRLIAVRRPRQPRAAVLVLHGGAARRQPTAVSATQLSVLRMIPLARRIARVGRGRLAVYRLLNSTRGWDTGHTPVQDAAWAMERITDELGSLPIGLVGHSLGGRAALLAGADDRVRSVVALAPWVYATDSADLGGRRVLVVHGSADRIASPERSAAVVRSIGRTTDVGSITIDGGKHAMLGHHRQFDGYAAAFTAAVLLPDDPPRVPEPIREVLDRPRAMLTV
jgi:pimeloyl-ACP methyl ester carboxylesterase